MENMKEILECDECERKASKGEIGFCAGCENIYCVKGGCEWMRDEDGLFICEACYPEKCRAGFFVDDAGRRLKVEPLEKYIFPGQDLDDAVKILRSAGYEEKYRLEGNKKIVKYGKDCGLYLLFNEEGRVTRIGMWEGLHKTKRGIALYASKEEVIEVYGDNFGVEEISGYISYYSFPDDNVIFMFTRVGMKRIVVTEIILY